MNKYKNIFIILFVGIILISSGCDSKNNNNDIVESTNEENNNQVGNTANTTNSYQIFADNLKEEISTFTSSTYNYQYVQSDCINDGYSVYLDNSSNLILTYFGKSLGNEINNYKVAENVLSFYIINTGQDNCNTLYYINEDGTVSSINTEYNIASKEDITVKNNIGNYKNIVSIVSFIVGADESGSRVPAFIDINGNMYYE